MKAKTVPLGLYNYWFYKLAGDRPSVCFGWVGIPGYVQAMFIMLRFCYKTMYITIIFPHPYIFGYSQGYFHGHLKDLLIPDPWPVEGYSLH